MRAVIQRVRDARVDVDDHTVGSVPHGLLVYLGVRRGDTSLDVEYVARKTVELRIFPDDDGKMNLSLLDLRAMTTRDGDAQPGILVISQFTLCADVRKGRRPSYNDAAPPDEAIPLYESFLKTLKELTVSPEAGVFREHMEVTYTNSGPVTIIIDSEKKTRDR